MVRILTNKVNVRYTVLRTSVTYGRLNCTVLLKTSNDST